MSIEGAMAGYYADRAQEYERVYLKPERQADLNDLRRPHGNHSPKLISDWQSLKSSADSGCRRLPASPIF
jgi:hypothetical protein